MSATAGPCALSTHKPDLPVMDHKRYLIPAARLVLCLTMAGVCLVGGLFGAATAQTKEQSASASSSNSNSQQSGNFKAGSLAKSAIRSKPRTRSAPITFATFLDRLMMAESDGRDHAANSRSSARGAFQFIDATFLFVMRRHFPHDIAGKTMPKILAMRHDRSIARKAAAAYSQDNAAYLHGQGLKPSFTNLRLAFLLGPAAAARVLSAKPATPLARLLSAGALRANPYWIGLNARALIAKAARDIALTPQNTAGLNVSGIAGTRRTRPRIRVRCNLSRASCKRWLALKKRRIRRRSRGQARRRKKQ